MMTLYHGTNVRFEKVELEKGAPGKDFGRGFYMTDSLECAEKTARQHAARLGGTATVLAFDFDDVAVHALRVRRFEKPCREWALFVKANRRSDALTDDHNRDNRFDLVVGPIANDKLSLQFRLFDKGLITLDAFVDGLRFSQLYRQYSFHTAAAVATLRFREARDVR